MKKNYFYILLLLSNVNFSQVAGYDFASGSGYDITGNGNNGTLFGASASIDTLLIGSNMADYFQIPSSVLNGQVEFSINFKVKFNGLNITGGSPTNHLISGDLASSFGSFAMSYQKDVNKWYVVNNGAVFGFNDASIIVEKWYCVCLTRSSGGVVKFYVNGIQNPSTYNNTSPIAITNLIFGQETDCYGGCFAANQATYGKFDNIKIYHNELSLHFIDSICSPPILPVSTCSDVANYNFTLGSGIDNSGNGNNGTLFGASASVDTLLIGSNMNDYFQIPASVLNGRLEFSILMKIKFNGFNVTGGSPTNHLISGDLSSSFGSFAMSYQKDINKWYVVNNGAVFGFNDASIIIDKWYCVCLTRSSTGVIKFYVNGIQNSSTYNNTSPIAITNLIFGQETDCYGGCFATNQSTNGKFDFIRICGGEISIQEINSKCSTGTLGINEINKPSYVVFPNPVINSVSINKAINITEIEIYSIDGKVLFKANYVNQSSINISMNEFESGIYFVRLISGKNEFTQKIIKN